MTVRLAGVTADAGQGNAGQSAGPAFGSLPRRRKTQDRTPIPFSPACRSATTRRSMYSSNRSLTPIDSHKKDEEAHIVLSI